MSRLVLHRERDGFGVLRQITVLVDGKKVTGLRPGERADLDLPPDQHEIVGRKDWTRSPALSVALSDDQVTEVDILFPFLSGFIKTFIRPSRAIIVRLRSKST